MKLKTVLINLVLLGAGLALAPAQASNNHYSQDDGWGLMKVKRGGDDHRYRDDDDDDDDDRRKRGKQEYRGSGANFSNFGGYNQRAIPRDSKPNFKEELYLQRKQEREENQQLSPDSSQR